MTPNEIQMLVCGIVIGAQVMNLLHACWGWRDVRRSLAESRQVRRRVAGDAFLRSLELYQVQQRYGLVP